MNRSDDPIPHRSSKPATVDCDWVGEHGPIHALGALDQDEADLLENHLLRCRECDEAVAHLVGFSSLLGAAVPQIEPPPAIKRTVMAAVRKPVSATSGSRSTPAAPRLVPAPYAAGAASRRLPGRFLVLPLIAALLLLGLWSADLRQDLGARRTEVARLQRQNEALTMHLSSIQAGRQFFGNSGIWYPLTTVDATAGEAGGIVLSGTRNTTTLLSVWNMPNEHDSYHVVCESKRGELLAAGEIQVNERGSGTITLNLPAPVSEYRAVHVVPVSGSTIGAEMLTRDILQLLLTEPTAVATAQS